MTDPGSRTPVLRDALARIEAGSHLCLIHESPAEQLAGVVPFLRLGLDRGERCLYFADGDTADRVLGALRAEGIDVGAALSSGALAIARTRDTYLREGRLDPDAMISLLGEAAEASRRSGFSALRVTGEMMWALAGDPGTDRLIEYEARVNQTLRSTGALAICQYHRHRFRPELIRNVIRTHPWVVVGGSVCRNHYYVPPERLPSPDGSEREVEGLLRSIRERAEIEAAQERGRREAEVVAELARSIGASLDIDTVLQRMADGARELCGAGVAEISLREDQGERLRVRYWSGVNSPAYRQVEVEPGKGIGGLVLQTRRPFRTRDYAADPRITKDYVTPTLEEGVTAHLVVPMLIDDQVEGLFYVGNRTGQAFTDEDQRILMSLAGQASIAIRNARLYQEAERRRRAAESLAEVGRLVSQSLDVPEVAQRIADSIRRLLGALASTLYRLDPESGDLVALAMSDSEEFAAATGRNMVLPRGTGLSGLAIREGHAVGTPNLVTDSRVLLTAEARARTEQSPFRAGLAVPLIANGVVLGTLAVGDRVGRVFDEDAVRLAQAFADQAAAALANARLYEEAERQRREAEILAALTATIGSTLSLDAVLQRVADGARELCRSDLAEIALRDPSANAMQFRYWAGLTSPGDRTLRVEPGKGMGGQVMLTGRPWRTDDYERDPRFTKDYLAHNQMDGIVAELVVPILKDARVDGLLYVSRRAPRPFTDRDEAILVRLAEHASIAITNARLYEQSERRRQEAVALAEVGRLLSQSLDVAEVGQRIVDSLRRLLGGIVATLYRIDTGSGALITLSTSGAADADWHPGIVLPHGTGISGRAVAERRPVTSLDVLTDPAIEIPPRLRARVERLGYRTALALPLLIQDRVIGVLGVGREAGRGFDEDETRLAQAFAVQAAIALENARLFEEQTRLLQQTRRQHDEALALELVGRQITSSLEREEVFQRIVDRTRLLCGCDVAYLATCEPATETAPIVAVAGARSEALLSVTLARGLGLGGTVLETGEPCTTEDYLHDPDIPQPFVEVAKAVGTVAEAVVPLQLRGATVGLLGVINRTPRRFTPKDIGLLSKFAVQAAIALENSRLYAERVRVEVELKVRARQQAVIAELGQRALAEPDVLAVMDEAIGLVARTLDVDCCEVLELLPEGNALVLRAGIGWKPGLVGRVAVGAGVHSHAGYALLRGEPVVVEDLDSETRFGEPSILREHGLVSGVSVVIRGAARPFGVLGAHTRHRRQFTRDDLYFLQSVANVLATAIGRGRAEDALRESEERFRAAFEQSRIGRALQTLDGRYFRVNRALCEIVGYSEEELLSLGWQAITHPEDREAARERSARLLADRGHAYVAEKRYRHRQGGVVWVALSVSLVRDATGRPLHYVSESEDITPRKQAEEALHQHAERLRMLHEIDRAIIGAQSPQAIAQAAVRRIRRLVPCRRTSVVLFDLDADQAVVLAVDVAGETRAPAGTILPLASAFGDLDDFRAGQIRVVEDALSPSAPSSIAPLEEDGLRSYVSVPLLSRNSLVGSLNLWSDAPGSFPPDQIQIARQVADSLAVAIQDSQLLAQVLAGRERLQALSRRLVEVQEAERRHIARELHDEIGQVLTGLKLTLEMGERPSGEGAARHREGARALVNDLISRVRELSLDLRPAMLDDLGLLPALLWHFERYTSQTAIRVRFEHAGIEQRFAPEVETAAYRIVQEALTNVARHAGVTIVEVRVWTDSETLSVQVEDRGRGFDAGAQAGASSGLAGMRERAVLLGGDLTVDSVPGAGTRLTAAIPGSHPLERRTKAR